MVSSLIGELKVDDWFALQNVDLWILPTAEFEWFIGRWSVDGSMVR